jgi:hypothetical protein
VGGVGEGLSFSYPVAGKFELRGLRSRDMCVGVGEGVGVGKGVSNCDQICPNLTCENLVIFGHNLVTN